MIRYLNPSDHHLAIIRKADWMIEANYILRTQSLLSKLDIFRNWKNNTIKSSVFSDENMEKYQLYVSKNTFKKHFDILFLEKKTKIFFLTILMSSCTIILYMVDQSVFCCYYLQAFSTREKSYKCLIDYCF